MRGGRRPYGSRRRTRRTPTATAAWLAGPWHAAGRRRPGGRGGPRVCSRTVASPPSKTTSTRSPSTSTADCSSRAYAGWPRSAAHASALPRVAREEADVREHREVHDAERAVAVLGSPLDEQVADPRGHHHAAGAHAHPQGVGQLGQQVGEARLVQPVGEVGRLAAVDEQHVGLAHRRHPAVRADRGERGQLEEPDGAPSRGRSSSVACGRWRSPATPARTSGGPTGPSGSPARSPPRSACRAGRRGPLGCCRWSRRRR